MDKNTTNFTSATLSELCEKLIGIFQTEEGVYLDLIKTEDLKKNAIMNRNADELLSISRIQEETLQVVDNKEKERSEIIRKISEHYNLGQPVVRISDIAGLDKITPDMKEKLLHHSYALRELMITLKNLTSTNREMLEDNKKLFDSLIIELTETPDTGYGPSGKSDKSKNAVFVNLNG